jgi:DNA-binding transcriptional MerR regulator
MTDKLLTTKQFAALCGVEKRTLFYYDEIDLLKPAHTTEAGYRLYLPEQFDTLSMIKALQSIGLSLEEIKALMNESNINKSTQLLEKQLPLLRQKQEELKQAEMMLSHTIKELKDYLETGCDAYYVTEQPEEYLITQQVESQSSSMFVNYLTNGYHHGVTIDDWSTMLPKLVYKKAPNRKKANAIKPAGTYACIYMSAPNGGVLQSIQNFIQLIKDKSWKVEGSIYMDEISSDFIRFPNQEYIFKFSIKLQ